jgi:hypothetical protein
MGTVGPHPVDGSADAVGPRVTTLQGMGLAVANDVIPGLLALVVIGATAVIAYQGRTVPDVLSNVDFAIVAFYFGVRGRGVVTLVGTPQS